MTDKLSEREELIAQRAAKLAVEEMTKDFYAQVGRGVIHRLLVYLGAAVVGFAVAKGWVTWKP